MSDENFISRRVRDNRSGDIFVVATQSRVVQHGSTRLVLYGDNGERAFAGECVVVPHDPDDSPVKRAHQAENREFASIIWQYEVNIPKPLMRAEAERRIAAHLDAFRLTVEMEREKYVGRVYEERIEKLREEINELKKGRGESL